MSKELVIAELNSMKSALQDLYSQIREGPARIWKTTIIKTADKIATHWFDTVKLEASAFGLSDSTIDYYNQLFEEILRLSTKLGPMRIDFRKTILSILSNFDEDFIIPVKMTTSSQSSVQSDTSDWDQLMPSVSGDESSYMEEAMNCAKAGFYRGSAVLGWSAAIDRLHRVIGKIGYDIFSQKSVEMKNEEKGRFRKWNKEILVKSLNDLRAGVFDTDLLWILEGLGQIDKNQHQRLSHCFEMRCHAAHPGDAPITKPNLLSFYSDLKEIIFDNPVFQP